MGTLLQQLRAGLEALAEPGRAAPMQAYMKSAMPFHGVPQPKAQALFKGCFQGLSFTDRAHWEAEVLALWTGATHREERYAALALAEHRSGRAFQTPEALPLYRRLILEGAWWDLVDDLAVHHVGALVLAHPEALKPEMLAWSHSGELWLRRAAILCQIGAKGRTDLALLEACIAPALGAREFFLRKAIGWALRQQARQDPAWVEAYVERHAGDMSPLSKREALKRLRPAPA